MSSESSRTNPLASFGQNEWLVDELYQKYLQDPESVDRAWWNFFADYNPDYGPGRTPGREAANGTVTAPSPAAPAQQAAAPAAVAEQT
ncbi:2-oxoglutarate dehydrogenase E1 subunit family protein, partial [Nonomuraea lactucae]|uniref:2-oxoglutarate dehydrogenase E1 subunit family protein n=1 Tax=Nonomuraea lactucae TaxID=2249762 RepID=UPI0013B414D9